MQDLNVLREIALEEPFDANIVLLLFDIAVAISIEFVLCLNVEGFDAGRFLV